MSTKEKLEQIIELADSLVKRLGLVLIDARFSQQGRRRTLEVTIFRKGGQVSHEDCEKVSREIDQALENCAPPLIEGSFLLEVQSPGLQRIIKSEREFSAFAGEMVEVKTKEKIGECGDHFKGVLIGLDGNCVNINNAEPIKVVAKAKGKHVPAKALLPAEKQSLAFDLKSLIQIRLYAEELFA